jgi:hypothetical protein
MSAFNHLGIESFGTSGYLKIEPAWYVSGTVHYEPDISVPGGYLLWQDRPEVDNESIIVDATGHLALGPT